MKFFWRRHNVAGQLAIEGRRLDASAPPLQADVPQGYGDTGFQATGLIFSSEGCWEVTGSVEEASLTFVALVVKIPFEPLLPDWIPEEMIDEGPDLSDFPQSLLRVYGFTGGGGGVLIVETTQGVSDETSYPEASKQQVTMKGQTGICVQGAWDESGEWLADADAGALDWTAGDLSYRISYIGLGLTCEDLLRVAGDPGG